MAPSTRRVEAIAYAYNTNVCLNLIKADTIGGVTFLPHKRKVMGISTSTVKTALSLPK